ncbi:GNAT family N-acetyltransferase [Hyphomonas sp.]|uniref:GNAT family N-acetyltransferase n=1 Tax=Hyphomonas sp. TaxID=87 RepID=UPI003F6F081B
MSILIRALSIRDSHSIAQIFFDAVHVGTQHLYRPDQRLAWAGDAPDPDAWREKLNGVTGFVAEVDGEPAGFMTIDDTGLIDYAFVAPSASRKGVGQALYKAVEDQARSFGAQILTTHASKAAKPFFSAMAGPSRKIKP